VHGGRQAPGGVADPDRKLGRGWRTSADRAVTSAADSDGLHVLVADSKDAYAWRTAAVLYWLDTGMSAQCSPTGRSLHCDMLVTP
jgi:hypothetical protein